MVVAVAFRFYCIRLLGRYFTYTVAADPAQEVVDRGPYRLVRHPSYSAILIAMLGAQLALGNWLSPLGLLPMLVAVAYRIGVEEDAMQRSIGDPYRDYMRRTKRLVPYVL